MIFAAAYIAEQLKKEDSLIDILRSFLRRSHLEQIEDKLLSLEDEKHSLTTLGATLWHLWSKKLCDLRINTDLVSLREGFKTKALKDENSPILIQVTNLHLFGMVYPRDQDVYEHLVEKTKHIDRLIRKAAVWAISQTDYDVGNTRKVLLEIIHNEVSEINVHAIN